MIQFDNYKLPDPDSVFTGRLVLYGLHTEVGFEVKELIVLKPEGIKPLRIKMWTCLGWRQPGRTRWKKIK